MTTPSTILCARFRRPDRNSRSSMATTATSRSHRSEYRRSYSLLDSDKNSVEAKTKAPAAFQLKTFGVHKSTVLSLQHIFTIEIKNLK